MNESVRFFSEVLKLYIPTAMAAPPHSLPLPTLYIPASVAESGQIVLNKIPRFK